MLPNFVPRYLWLAALAGLASATTTSISLLDSLSSRQLKAASSERSLTRRNNNFLLKNAVDLIYSEGMYHEYVQEEDISNDLGRPESG